ncbi:MAG TPA: TonB-dependent receptor plug domain-containing protein [Candidatus Didemnitutus sp.]|nr:TonB-dependent receptor plug domain-containing protein [Candidatus Didemnitutus sp.]
MNTLNNRARTAIAGGAALLCLTWGHAQVAPANSPAADPSTVANLRMLAADAPAAGNAPETITLSPFEVTADKNIGYQATETLAGSRIRTNLGDVASSIQVITKEFMNDVGATDNGTLLQFTTNAEVGGTRGTYAGVGNGTTPTETAELRAPASAQRVRGLAAADNTRDFFVTDIPWDSYNVDRIDIQRGPNSILFGLGSPAGIVNASIHNAEFRDTGDVEFRTGSYGSTRSSIDVNQQLIDNVLAVRIDGLWNNQKYEQKQAYQHDKRFSGMVRFDPQLFKDPSFHTSIKAKFENGDIKADRPRTLPPADSLTPWFAPVSAGNPAGGMGKLLINSAYGITAQPQNVNPWLAAGIFANQQQPLWTVDGTTNELYRISAGYINNGFIDNTGAFRGVGNSALGQTYSDQFYGLTSYDQYALLAKVPGYQYGQFRQKSLLDPSVFDFYHNLIDGPTASQFEKWNAFNLDVQQTAFDDRLGIDLSYDRQKYKRGGQSLMGNPTLNIDVLQNFQDLTANPNVGRPYVLAGPGSGNSYQSDRKYYRGSIFGEVRASDWITKGSFLEKLLGYHRFNGVYSDEKYSTINHNWQMFANSREWDGYWNVNDGSSNNINNRAPSMVIYLGPSIAGMNSASGAYIPAISAPVNFTSGNVYQFNSQWKNLPGVTPSAAWTPPANSVIFPSATPPTGGYTQASNPANYVGWNTNVADNLIVDNMDNNPQLLTKAQQTFRETKSYAGSWQGFLWNEAIVPTLGWRYDEVESEAVTASPVTTNRGELNLNTSGAASTKPYVLPTNGVNLNGNQSYSLFKNHSTAGGVVLHVNKLFGEKDPLPINVSLSYNKSNNFQVTDTRHDFFGNVLDNPTGATKEYGLVLSTKDGKYSFRAVKYDTSITNGSASSIDLTGLAGTIVQGLKFRNVFLYQMSNYTWVSREDGYVAASNSIVVGAGNRHFWTPAYINSNGRPVADLNGQGGSTAGATLETQAQADAHRDASINAWNDIQKNLAATNFFNAWNFTPTTLSALTDRTTYAKTLGPNTEPAGPGSSIIVPVQNNASLVPDPTTLASYVATAPTNITVSADTRSRGYEYELTANPLPNWRIALNAAETTAVQNNVGGGQLDAFVAYMDTQMAGVAGDMRQFNGNYVAGNELRQTYANWRGQYTLLKLQEGADVAELRKWRFNFITNYTFDHGFLKNVGVGAGYRWQDKVVIGYPVVPGANGLASFDLSKPYYGPSEGQIDLWTSYERRLTKKINWKIQFNVTNVGKKNSLIPVSIEPDGQTWATARIAPVQEWFVTNTLTF